jgi:hypothetical protein
VPTPVSEHPVPVGPLSIRYHAYELLPVRAGTTSIATVDLENTGSATLQATGAAHLRLSYHWLDRLGNPIVWDGLRTSLPMSIPPGARVQAWLRVEAPLPPGPYRLAIDMVSEQALWLADLGNFVLTIDVDVLPRLARRALAVRVGDGPAELVEASRAALAAQVEPVCADGAEATAFLAAGCLPAPDWSRLLLDAHEEGYAAVAGSIAVEGGPLTARGLRRELAPWAPGFGRAPGWQRPLLCPSLVAELADRARLAQPVLGLPALDPATLEEPWLCDGRIRVTVPARALRRSGRPSA